MQNSGKAFSFCRLPSVLEARGNRSRSSHYDDIQKGLYTHGIPVGPRAVCWPLHEVQALNAARIAGKSDDEIRQLVVTLEAMRKSALDEALKIAEEV